MDFAHRTARLPASLCMLATSRQMTGGASLSCSAKAKILDFSAHFRVYKSKSEEFVNLENCIH